MRVSAKVSTARYHVVVAMLIAGMALKWVLIGLGLTVLWYLLAPLFTPKPLRGKRGASDEEPTIIEGKGRVIDE